MKLFVVLAPGEKFETTVRTGVFGADDAAKNKSGNGLLAKGMFPVGTDSLPETLKLLVVSDNWRRNPPPSSRRST